MSDPQHKRIYKLVVELNPEAFKSRIAEWRKYGLPSSSVPGGSRSANPSQPKSDKTDTMLAEKSREHAAAMNKLEEAATAVANIESAVMAMPADRARELATEQISPRGVECKNCRRIVENTPNDRVFGGRCRNCNDYLKLHGEERPRELWEAEIERQVAKLARRTASYAAGMEPRPREPRVTA